MWTLAFQQGGLKLKQRGTLGGGVDDVTVCGAIRRFEALVAQAPAVVGLGVFLAFAKNPLNPAYL